MGKEYYFKGNKVEIIDNDDTHVLDIGSICTVIKSGNMGKESVVWVTDDATGRRQIIKIKLLKKVNNN